MGLLELSFASGESSLSARQFSVKEAMSELFEIRVMARSPSDDLDLEAIVGQPALFRIQTDLAHVQVDTRLWTGICRSLEQVRVEPSGLSTYELVIVPALWMLTQRRNNRLFQHISIPDIIDRLLTEWRLPYDWHIDRAQYPKLELRVQYGETDYAFFCRLLEEAGIAFYFSADDAGRGSVLVLHDRPHANDPRPGPPLPFVDSPGQAQSAQVEYVTQVRVGHDVRSGRYTIRDFDFRRPAFPLFGEALVVRPSETGGAGEPALEAAYEQYHYQPGAALIEGAKTNEPRPADVNAALFSAAGSNTPVADDKGVARFDQPFVAGRASRMLEAERAQKRAVRFRTDALDLAPGVVCAISDHPRPDLAPDRRLLIVEQTLAGAYDGEWKVDCRALFVAAPYRPKMVTEKPRIRGLQSAIVVGPPGEEIYTDEFGRVRVQFHWDREGQFDDSSSIWMRVSQAWAGPGYGVMMIPRVGHEVLVGFLDGDPDDPIIVGRVYNGSAQVPYRLPDHKTVSTWKSDSSPGSDGFNEIKYEDKKGQELLYIQAEKDLAKLVKHDEVALIGRNRSTVVENDDTLSVKHDRTKVVQNDERTAVGRDRIHQVRNDEQLAIGHDRSKLVHNNESETTGRDRSVTVGMNRSTTVGINDTSLVGAKWSVTMAQGFGAKLAQGVGGLLDGSVLGGFLGPLLGPAAGAVTSLIQGPLSKVLDPVFDTLQATPIGQTPIVSFLNGPMGVVSNTLTQFLPGPIQGVAGALVGPLLQQLTSPGDIPPTKIEMVDKRIILTTGEASIVLDGPNISLVAKGDIVLHAEKQIRAMGDEGVVVASPKAIYVVSSGSDVVVQGGPMVHINPGAQAEQPRELSPEETLQQLMMGPLGAQEGTLADAPEGSPEEDRLGPEEGRQIGLMGHEESDVQGSEGPTPRSLGLLEPVFDPTLATDPEAQRALAERLDASIHYVKDDNGRLVPVVVSNRTGQEIGRITQTGFRPSAAATLDPMNLYAKLPPGATPTTLQPVDVFQVDAWGNPTNQRMTGGRYSWADGSNQGINSMALRIAGIPQGQEIINVIAAAARDLDAGKPVTVYNVPGEGPVFPTAVTLTRANVVKILTNTNAGDNSTSVFGNDGSALQDRVTRLAAANNVKNPYRSGTINVPGTVKIGTFDKWFGQAGVELTNVKVVNGVVTATATFNDIWNYESHASGSYDDRNFKTGVAAQLSGNPPGVMVTSQPVQVEFPLGNVSDISSWKIR